jgi:hypothetical protein
VKYGWCGPALGKCGGKSPWIPYCALSACAKVGDWLVSGQANCQLFSVSTTALLAKATPDGQEGALRALA